jgi:hypothetical protein
MNPDNSQDPALRTSVVTSPERALLRIFQLNPKGFPRTVTPLLFQRGTHQAISLEKLRSTLQAALDLTSSEDFDLDFELDEEFEALERSVLS